MKPETTETTPGPTSIETLMGEGKMTVTFRPVTRGAPSVSAEINILQLEIEQLPALLMAVEDEVALVELYTGQQPGWARTLTIKSFREVLEEGERINADFFVIGRARAARVEKVLPGMLERKLGLSPSPNT